MIKCCCKYDSEMFLQIFVTCMICLAYRGNVEGNSSYFVSQSFSWIHVLRVVIVCANPSRQYMMATGPFWTKWPNTNLMSKLQIHGPPTGFVATWNAKFYFIFGNFSPKTRNYCLENRAVGFPGNRFVAVLLLAIDVVLIPWKFSTIIWPEWYAGHPNLFIYQDASRTQVIEKQKPSSGTAFATPNFE